MLLSYKLKLNPTEEQAQLLMGTMRRFNEACDFIADALLRENTANRAKAHHIAYRVVRERFGLSAQMTTRAIAKVCASLKARRNKKHFRSFGAIDYDARTLSWKGENIISILTLTGREKVPIIPNPHFKNVVGGLRPQTKLVYRKGLFYLIVSSAVPEIPLEETHGFLGVDLGQKNLAVDSDGDGFSGERVECVRNRVSVLRNGLQSCRTRNAKRHLKDLSGYERRFQNDINHCISKKIVAKAKGTHRAIALEDLKGIRERTVVRKAQRRNHNSWAFRQLADFIEYKARLNGVPVVKIDPKYTSQTCPICKHISRKNRISQAEFKCESCGFAGHADHVGAINIALRGYTGGPIVSGDCLSHVGQPQKQAINVC